MYKARSQKENLNLILDVQKCFLNKGDLDYSYSNFEKYYENFFIEASTSLNHLISCNYCWNKWHISSSWYIRKNNFRKGKCVWIQKGTKKPYFIDPNQKGPNMIWVPKKRKSCAVGMSQIYIQERWMVSR